MINGDLTISMPYKDNETFQRSIMENVEEVYKIFSSIDTIAVNQFKTIYQSCMLGNSYT